MRAIICGGGTGGHIYPALAIINKIKEEEPNSEFLYIGTHNRMEKDIIPKYNISYFALRMYGLKRSLSLSNIKTAYYYINSIKKAKKVIKDFNTLKKYLGNGYKKDYNLIMQEICVIENADYFDNSVYEYLMTTVYE